jgi:hypothetical protein
MIINQMKVVVVIEEVKVEEIIVEEIEADTEEIIEEVTAKGNMKEMTTEVALVVTIKVKQRLVAMVVALQATIKAKMKENMSKLPQRLTSIWCQMALSWSQISQRKLRIHFNNKEGEDPIEVIEVAEAIEEVTVEIIGVAIRVRAIPLLEEKLQVILIQNLIEEN